MKRPIMASSSSSSVSVSESNPNPNPSSIKKPKLTTTTKILEHHQDTSSSQFSKLDENLLYEIFKHVDAKTLAISSCVCTQWHRTSHDERLWEMICTRHWSQSINYGTQQLRSVVLALGGFRGLHALYLSKTAPTTSLPPSLLPPSLKVVKGGSNSNKRWGKDEVNLSLSLLSIRFYEKMNLPHKRP